MLEDDTLARQPKSQPATEQAMSPFSGWRGALWVRCERCKLDRRLPADYPVPSGLWYCEFNTDPFAEGCTPTVNVPLRSCPKILTSRLDRAGPDPNMPNEHVEQMVEAFLKLKEDGVEREIPLANGWTASFRKRKRTDGGDACITKLGEPSLRSLPDIRRRFGSSSME